MQDRVGDEFAALVLNPAKYGLFVELTDLFVEGLVPIDTLRADRYTWRENTHEIVGERTGRRFRAGDRVQVILDRVLAQERKLQFALVEEELPLTGKKAAPSVKIEEEQAQKHIAAAPGREQAAIQKGQKALTSALGPCASAAALTRPPVSAASGPITGMTNLFPLECLDDGDEPANEERKDARTHHDPAENRNDHHNVRHARPSRSPRKMYCQAWNLTLGFVL